MSECDTNEVLQAYQKSIKDKELLENENIFLKNELRKVKYIATHPNELLTHSRSVSNASSQNDEDYGYASGRNTLDTKKSPHNEGDVHSTNGTANRNHLFITFDRTFKTPEHFDKRGKIITVFSKEQYLFWVLDVY